MTKKILLLGLIIALLPLASLAQRRDVGVGVIVGEPTGISWKVWSGWRTAFAGSAAWSLGRYDDFHLQADYLFHHFKLFSNSEETLPFYYGIGLRFLFQEKNGSHTRVGIRFPLGLEYIFASQPVELYMEIVPVLDLSPGTNLDLSAGLGFRFYF